MIGHYIEDDDLDAFSLAGLISGDTGLSITTSRSLDDISDWLQPDDVDFVLLDINRPDAKSLAGDIAVIREVSSAPVIFVTGDEAHYYREQAIVAGAQAVLEKGSMTLESLQTVLKNVVSAQAGRISPADHDHQLTDYALESGPGQIDVQRAEAAFAYLRTILSGLSDSDADDASVKSTLSLIANLLPSLQLYIASPVSADHPPRPARSLPAIVRSIQKAALATAKKRKVKLVFQMGAGVLEGLEQTERVHLGVRHFLHSVIISASRGSTVSFTCSPTAQGIRLTASASEPLGFSADHVFGRTLPDEPESHSSTIAMTLATMLLGVEAGDSYVFSRGSLHTVMIDYHE